MRKSVRGVQADFRSLRLVAKSLEPRRCLPTTTPGARLPRCGQPHRGFSLPDSDGFYTFCDWDHALSRFARFRPPGFCTESLPQVTDRWIRTQPQRSIGPSLTPWLLFHELWTIRANWCHPMHERKPGRTEARPLQDCSRPNEVQPAKPDDWDYALLRFARGQDRVPAAVG